MKRKLVLFTLLILSFCITLFAQKKPAAKIEPLRVAGGVMKDNRILISRSNWISETIPLYEYRLASAWIVNGQLEFTGSLVPVGKEKAQVVKAMLISSTARSANPWPNASAPTARDRRPPQTNRPPERSEVNEQTQSLYSAAEAGSGCEIIYLKIPIPGQAQPTQLGVVLAHIDNQLGGQINQAICRVARAINAKENTEQALSRLNRLISRE